MKIPKRISEIINKRQLYIDQHRGILEKDVLKLQSELLNMIISEVIPSLDVEDGIIKDTKHNYQVLSELDRVYGKFQSISAEIIVPKISVTTAGLVDLGRNYFAVAIPDLPEKFDKIIESTASKINARLGLNNGKIVRGGFLEGLIKDNTISTQVKNYMSKAVTGQIDMKDFTKGLTKIIHGDKGPGALEKQYQRFAYDIYQQYDRAYNNSLADEFGMKYFLYQGGLIDDSRDFCVAHNRKVWTREEAEEWSSWTPSQGEYPEGYEIKQKDHYSVPSYLNYPGYQPLIDAGGYNCRHSIGWISDELAFELRPGLKNNE